MARASFVFGFLLILACGSPFVDARDPVLLADFSAPAGKNITWLDGNFFTFTGFRQPMTPPPGKFQPTKGFVDAFPALTGLGISSAFLTFEPGSLNVPHTHPRATELLYVIDGILVVGFIDTTNKIFKQTLLKGDVFVFPEGLVHFQMNPSTYAHAQALAAFSSASPGTVSLPATLFGSGISESVLREAFSVDSSALKHLKAPFAPKHW